MVKATGNRLRITSQSIAGMAAAGNSARIVKRSPMVSTPSMPAYVRSAQTPAVSTTMATSDPGIRRENLGVRTISSAAHPHGQVRPVDRTEMAEIEHPLADEIPRHGFPAEIHPEQVCDLRRENRQGDAGCEPHHDGIGNEPDDGAEFEQPHRDQQHAGHERRNQQPRFAVLLDDAVDDDDEGTRRAADLYPASAQQRDDEPRDHGRDDSLFGRHAEAIPKAIASGRATMPTTRPAIRSAENV